MGLGLSLGLYIGRGSGAGSFTPSSLGADLLDMWDAEDASKFTLSGASVNAWASSKNGYSAVQGVSASKPVYGAASFNGRPGVTFDGSDDELTYAGVGVFPVGAAACEVWTLVNIQHPGAQAGNGMLLAYGTGGTAGSRRIQRASGGGINVLQASIGNGTGGAFPASSADFGGIHVGRIQVGATTTSVQVDGGTAGSAAVIPATGSTRTRLGASDAPTAASFLQGIVSLIAITNPLSAAQAAQMLAYLKARGGIP